MTTEKITQSYSSKATAVRGAKRAGLADGTYEIRANAEGRFEIISVTSTEGPTKSLGDQIWDGDLDNNAGPGNVDASTEGVAANHDDAGEAIKDHAKKVIRDAAKKGEAPVSKAPSYKEVQAPARSTILKPVEFAHRFFDEHPDLTRKQAVLALVEKGCNLNMARSQYQRWFKKRKDGK